MRARWQRFVAWCHRDADVRPLALIRVFVALCIAGDLAQAGWLGVVRVLWTPATEGGVAPASPPAYVVDSLLGVDAAPVALWAVTLLASLCVAVGVWTRPALLVTLIAYAQLGHLDGVADRGIDRLLRTVLLVLLFSESDRRYALTGRSRVDTTAAWPLDLVRWLLFLVYMSAGVGKILGNGPAWVGLTEWPALYRVLTDPLAAYLDPVAWQGWWWPFTLGSIATLVVECSAFLVLTRWARWWAVCAAPIHIGIAATMKLGMFSYGMLALYPALLAPWIVALLDRRSRG